MARPAGANSAATRQRILSEALALFSECGAEGVSIRRIAAASGVSLAMVHHYFGSKERLYAACVDAMYDELLALQPRLLEAVARGGPIPELIDVAVREGFRFARAHRIAMRLLLRQVVAAGELDERRRRRGQEPFLDRGSEVLAAALGRDRTRLRLTLQSAAFLVARYAISSDSEIERLTERRGAAALAAVEDHLVGAVRALLQ